MIPIPRELYARLKALALRNDRPVTREVIRAITAHLDKEEQLGKHQ
jgi:hypothetical protein